MWETKVSFFVIYVLKNGLQRSSCDFVNKLWNSKKKEKRKDIKCSNIKWGKFSGFLLSSHKCKIGFSVCE